MRPVRKGVEYTDVLDMLYMAHKRVMAQKVWVTLYTSHTLPRTYFFSRRKDHPQGKKIGHVLGGEATLYGVKVFFPRWKRDMRTEAPVSAILEAQQRYEATQLAACA